MRKFLIGLFIIFSSATPALAVDVASGSVSLNTSNSVQLGRLSRNGVPQDFSGSEDYPGLINPAVSYSYTSLTVPFAANAYQDVYYGINFDDIATDLFSSAYLNSYDPNDKALNWLGDAGTSGDYFGTNALFYGVLVPKGNVLTLVFNSATGVNQTSSADYLVQAFSSTEYDEDFVTVGAAPEPATWMMMILGFGIAGFAIRRRHDATARIPVIPVC